jgi:tRNA 2-thiocytidine biosynthesis protein TtcA
VLNQSAKDPISYVRPSKRLLHKTGKAIADYSMIMEGDRILLGLSGGKDSFTLLHTLLHLQRHAPVHFDLAAVTVDPQSDSYNPRSLLPYMESLGVPYFYQSEPILKLAQQHLGNKSYCSFCARMKRGVMYTTARKHGFNVVALAQHLDDLAESFMMSTFHGGRLNTMKAHYTIDAGDLRVIRPFIYVRETQTRDFATSSQLPVIPENCPACFDMPTQRFYFKALLQREEQNNPALYKSLLSAMRPLMVEGLPATIKCSLGA